MARYGKVWQGKVGFGKVWQSVASCVKEYQSVLRYGKNSLQGLSRCFKVS